MRALPILLVIAGCVDERAPPKPADLARAADLATRPPDLASPPDLALPPDLATVGHQAGPRYQGGGLRGGSAASPVITLSKPTVRGALPVEVVERIARRHLNQLLFCYEKEVMRNPKLGGTLTLEAVIASTGDVVSAVTRSSTVGSPEVERCFTDAIRRWAFPQPSGGGIVIVSLPLKLVSNQ